MRKLKETSWLSQILADKMEVEFSKNGESSKWSILNTFKFFVIGADTSKWGMFYDNEQGTNNRLIVVPSIPYGMQPQLLGMAERCTDDEGNYTVSVKVTHDFKFRSNQRLSFDGCH